MNEQSISPSVEHKFDWQAARQRMAAIKAELAMENETPPEVLERVWAERSAQLAKAPVQEDDGEHINLVLVQLGNEVFGLDTQYVYDIRPAAQITPVPRLPDWILGVYNLRGHIFSVIDLPRFLGLPKPEGAAENNPNEASLTIVKTPAMEIALLVPEVLAVESLPASQVQEPTTLMRGLRPEYVHGVIELESDADNPIAVVLNIQAILADKRLIINQENT